MFKIHPRFAELGLKFFTYTAPTAVAKPHLMHVNRSLQSDLGLNSLTDDYLMQLLAGNTSIAEYPPLASVYAGHQFGIAVPQLGDGRALLIAEHQAPDQCIWELQLKGSGKTPYSRMGDGRAVLRSTIREYLVSQAMHSLNIPTTLALAMIDSATAVYREMPETSAVLLRLAPSFIRFGHFEFFASRGQKAELKQLLNFVGANYYAQINLTADDYVLQFLAQIVRKSAELVAQWQGIGFVHGVMNSDNMSILGLTLDYGPFMFMDAFQPEYAYNHSDSSGRYVYSQQAQVMWWNLYRLAEALSLIYPYPQQLEAVLATYADYYHARYSQIMQHKLGLLNTSAQNLTCVENLLTLVASYKLDWTYTWRQLSNLSAGYAQLQRDYSLGEDFAAWYQQWQQLLAQQGLPLAQVQAQMLQANPALILRHHLMQKAIADAADGDYAEINRLFQAVANPYQQLNEFAEYYQLPPKLADQQLSCSS